MKHSSHKAWVVVFKNNVKIQKQNNTKFSLLVVLHVNFFCFKEILFIRKATEHFYKDTSITFAVQLRLLDVAVLFDWSSSFRDDYWNYILTYVRGFVDRLGISPDPRATHVSMIGYSSSPSVIFNFKAPSKCWLCQGTSKRCDTSSGLQKTWQSSWTCEDRVIHCKWWI